MSSEPDRSSDAKPDTSSPTEWLYISRRLELDYLPNTFLWSAPVVILGTQSKPAQPYFRLTPSVYAWFVRAGAALEQSIAQGRASPADADEYVRVMREVDAFASRYLPREWVEAALLTPGSLPPVDRVVMSADW